MESYTVDKLLTEKALSAWLGISLPNLQRLRTNGNGPRFVKLSERRIAYRRADVEDWLERRTVSRVDDNPNHVNAV